PKFSAMFPVNSSDYSGRMNLRCRRRLLHDREHLALGEPVHYTGNGLGSLIEAGAFDLAVLIFPDFANVSHRVDHAFAAVLDKRIAPRPTAWARRRTEMIGDLRITRELRQIIRQRLQIAGTRGRLGVGVTIRLAHSKGARRSQGIQLILGEVTTPQHLRN